MSEPNPTPENQPTDAPAHEAEVPAAETLLVEEEVPVDPLTAALADAAQWKDMAYRNAAELDNFRKRSAREAQEARAYANADLLRSLFPIIDNFEMGLEAARQESEKSMIFMGMSMVQRQITDFIREMGVIELEALNKPFDPNLHEAMAQEIRDDLPEGTILRVSRKGYKQKERLLRAASVIVSAHTPVMVEPAA
jgi:molecular chaperone GrpE